MRKMEWKFLKSNTSEISYTCLILDVWKIYEINDDLFLNFVAGIAPCKKQFENQKEEESENCKGRWQSGEEATETD